ncbi:MAG: hypothetical protein ACI4C1_00965 [Lachnospiraceae bacterium]
MTIRLAEHNYTIENKFSFVEKLCQDYVVEPDSTATVISISEEEIYGEYVCGLNQDQKILSAPGYLESLAVYRKICEDIIKDDVILFHCSAIAMDGKAYLFTAPSGTGKSTHTRLWREYFNKKNSCDNLHRVIMINDDKPLLAVRSEEVLVYGTPYSGKDSTLHTNTSEKVAGIIILHQAPENHIERLTAEQAYPMLLNQTYRSKRPENLIKILDLVHILSKLPVFSLGCTISREAVEMAYKALSCVDGS